MGLLSGIFGSGSTSGTTSGTGTSSTSGSGTGTSTGINAAGVMALLGQVESILKTIWPGFSLKSNGFSQMEEVLGEKYMYHVLGVDIHDRNLVPAEKISEAKQVMPALFGVPLYDILDVNALEVSVEEYQKSPRAQGVPIEAIQRAVHLKKNFFPYSKRLWDVSDANKIPMVGYNTSGSGTSGTGGVQQNNLGGNGKVSSGIWVGIGIFIAGILAVISFVNRNKRKGRRYY